jgi:hypothetical protein
MTTDHGRPKFVLPEERIATFDQDRVTGGDQNFVRACMPRRCMASRRELVGSALGTKYGCDTYGKPAHLAE